MKLMTTKQSVATAINTGKYPVLTIDLANKDEYGFKGCNVKIETKHDFYIHATLRVYSDERTLTTSAAGTMISSSFTYSDMEDLLAYANAPIIKADQDVMVCFIDSKKRTALQPMIIHTSSSVDTFCSTPLGFEKNDMSWMFSIK